MGQRGAHPQCKTQARVAEPRTSAGHDTGQAGRFTRIDNGQVAELADLPAAYLPAGRAGRRAGPKLYNVLRLCDKKLSEELYLCWLNEQPGAENKTT